MSNQPFAMILAAGFGTRLLPLTLHRPKPALDFLGQPLIFHHLHMLQMLGIKDVAINAHHHKEYIKNILEKYKSNIKIHLLEEEKLLGTAGGVRNAIDKLKISQDLLIIQGDIILDYDLSHFIYTDDFVKLLCIKDKTINGYEGNIEVNKYNLITALGKYYKSSEPSCQKGFFTGVHMLSKKAVNLIKDYQQVGITDEIYPLWLREKREVKAVMIEAFYDDLGTPERLLKTNLLSLKKSRLKKPLIGKNCSIDKTAVIGENVIIGDNCCIEAHAHIENSVIMSKTTIKQNENVFHTLALLNERVVIRGG